MGRKILFIFPLLSLLCCKRTVTEVETKTVIVTQNIFICHLQSGNSSAELLASKIQSPTTSSVSIKGGSYNGFFPLKTIEPGKLVFNDTTKLGDTTTYTIKLSSSVGSTSGTIKMPDSTHITIPVPEDTIQLGDTVKVKWRKISKANFYEVKYTGLVRSQVGEIIGELPEQYRFISDTFFTVPDSYFNVADTNAKWYNISVDVAAYTGPAVQANAAPNMSGSVKGFLYASSKTVSRVFYYGVPKFKGKIKSITKQDKSNSASEIIEVLENIQKN